MSALPHSAGNEWYDWQTIPADYHATGDVPDNVPTTDATWAALAQTASRRWMRGNPY